MAQGQPTKVKKK